MRQAPSTESLLAYTFAAVLGLTVVLYLLRGLEIVTFLPGGVYSVLILLSIAIGILYGIQRTRRY